MSQQKSTFIFILTLGILSMLPPFGVDMYLPSFLEIAKDLGVSPEQVQHTLTSFAYGMAFGQLFWGPFGDSFGRKPIILLGVIVGALTALVLTEINSVGNFTALRFVQGFFGAAPVVLSGALLRDLFSKDQLSKVMSTITLVFMLAPLVAPIIGGSSALKYYCSQFPSTLEAKRSARLHVCRLFWIWWVVCFCYCRINCLYRHLWSSR